jgi:hypothetical protein
MKLGVAFVMTMTIGVDRVVVATEPPDPTAPSAVLQELQSSGCKLPGKRSKGAVIRGEFFKAGQSDWAALCLMKKSASLMVFPEGSRERVEVLETIPKGFSKWSVSVANQERLTLTPPMRGAESVRIEIDHQGIFSAVDFDNGGGCLYCYSSTQRTYYHHQDKWRVLAGVDIN